MKFKFKQGLWYFAHPYTVKDVNGRSLPEGQEANFKLCCYRSAELIKRGYMIYSPIVASHPIHISDPDFLRRNEWELWMDLDKEIIKRTKFTGIILAPNWQDSTGCNLEKTIFESNDKKVLFYNDIINKEVIY